MNRASIAELKKRLFFTAQDVSRVFDITLPSAHVLCSRYVKQGTFIRVKKNFYVLDQNWERYGTKEFFSIANFLQVPSYISCMSALSHYEITTQVQRGWFESITQRRSIRFEARDQSFQYHKIHPRFYFGFVRMENVFIAEPEKALLDAAYLAYLNRYSLDWSALNLDSLDASRLNALVAPYPAGLKRIIGDRCRS